MTDCRAIHICNQTRWRRIFWPGGVYYINFRDDTSDITVWIHENIKTRNIKIAHDEIFEGSDKYDSDNEIKKTVYKVYFRRKIDFVAFKLTWL